MRMGENLLAPARLAMQREALPASAKICQVVPALSENESEMSRRSVSPWDLILRLTDSTSMLRV